MTSLKERFDAAAEDVKKLPKEPTNDEKLVIYGLFKQGTVGDCNTDRPGLFDITGKAKWDAWNLLKGKSQDEARTEYISKVEALQKAYN